jgi:hypothetical protein
MGAGRQVLDAHEAEQSLISESGVRWIAAANVMMRALPLLRGAR